MDSLHRGKGVLCALLAGFIYGFTPILTRLTYDGGNNGVNMTFLRGLLALPVLFVLVRAHGEDMRLTAQQVRAALLCGLGSAATTVALYMSYSYTSVGMATTLHFIYPVLIVVAGLLFFREKLGRGKAIALALAVVGVFCFMEAGSASFEGYALALSSAVTFCIYLMIMERSSLSTLFYFKLSFYLSLVTSAITGLFGAATGNITFAMTPQAWGLIVIIALCASVGALPLMQVAVRNLGAATTGILSTFEPITSIVLGILVLGESLTPVKAIGCLLILSSVVLITLAETKSPPAETKSPPLESERLG